MATANFQIEFAVTVTPRTRAEWDYAEANPSTEYGNSMNLHMDWYPPESSPGSYSFTLTAMQMVDNEASSSDPVMRLSARFADRAGNLVIADKGVMDRLAAGSPDGVGTFAPSIAPGTYQFLLEAQDNVLRMYVNQFQVRNIGGYDWLSFTGSGYPALMGDTYGNLVYELMHFDGDPPFESAGLRETGAGAGSSGYPLVRDTELHYMTEDSWMQVTGLVGHDTGVFWRDFVRTTET